MEGLFGYIAVFILGVICGAVFMRKTSPGNNGNAAGGNGGLFGMFGRNRNQGVGRPMQSGNMMNQGMPRPGMPQQPRPPVMPGQNQYNQPPQNGYNNQNNGINGGW